MENNLQEESVMLFARKKLLISATILVVISSPLFARPSTALVLSDTNSFRVIQESLSPKTNIIIFGDSDHRSQGIKKMFFHFVKTLHQMDNSFECVFIEDSRRFQKNVDKFLSGSSFEETIVQAQKDIIPQQHYERSVKKTFFNQSFLEYLRENRLKLFPYDVPFFEERFDKILYLQQKIYHGFGTKNNYIELMDFLLVHRNKSMSERVRFSIEQNECKKSIIMIGTGHMNQKKMKKLLGLFLSDEEIKTFGDHMHELKMPYQYYIIRDIRV